MNLEDRSVLRHLAATWAECAGANRNRQCLGWWRDLNDLKPVRPLVWVNELPWQELAESEELQLCCADPVARSIEEALRRPLYQWRHFRGDMILEPCFDVPVFLTGNHFGLDIEETQIEQGVGDLASHEYHSQIRTEQDAMRITAPRLAVDRLRTEAYRECAANAFGDLLPLRDYGIPTWWFAPWDWITMRWKVEEALMALVLEPELVHLVMQRFLDANLSMLDQMEEQGLLRCHSGNYRVGSGGMGCCSALPESAEAVTPRQQWGCAVAQIFGEVSPEMHEEFALRYERQWLERFALTYYGCCEALHNKVALMRTIPNLRKLSASPWCDLEKLIAQTNRDYVISLKPNPAIFATDRFDVAAAERQLRRDLSVLRGANIEIILKDVSTVRGDAERLTQWMCMATRVCEEYV